MKKITLVIFILAMYTFAQAQDMKGMDMSKNEKVQQATYTCSMHPEIHAAKPGNCLKCGMKLIKEKAKTVKQSSNKNKQQQRTSSASSAITGFSPSGLDDEESQAALQAGWTPLRLGPRVLRTETAGLAALAALQLKFGDF